MRTKEIYPKARAHQAAIGPYQSCQRDCNANEMCMAHHSVSLALIMSMTFFSQSVKAL